MNTVAMSAAAAAEDPNTSTFPSRPYSTKPTPSVEARMMALPPYSSQGRHHTPPTPAVSKSSPLPIPPPLPFDGKAYMQSIHTRFSAPVGNWLNYIPYLYSSSSAWPTLRTYTTLVLAHLSSLPPYSPHNQLHQHCLLIKHLCHFLRLLEEFSKYAFNKSTSSSAAITTVGCLCARLVADVEDLGIPARPWVKGIYMAGSDGRKSRGFGKGRKKQGCLEEMRGVVEKLGGDSGVRVKSGHTLTLQPAPFRRAQNLACPLEGLFCIARTSDREMVKRFSMRERSALVRPIDTNEKISEEAPRAD